MKDGRKEGPRPGLLRFIQSVNRYWTERATLWPVDKDGKAVEKKKGA